MAPGTPTGRIGKNNGDIASKTNPQPPSWLWIRWIPIKLHLAIPLLAFVVGGTIDDNPGIGTHTCATLGLIVGFMSGMYAQYWKFRAYDIALEFYPPSTALKTCQHCGAPLEMKSFRLYHCDTLLKCPNCRRPTQTLKAIETTQD